MAEPAIQPGTGYCTQQGNEHNGKATANLGKDRHTAG
jgi:hypothetical protein